MESDIIVIGGGAAGMSAAIRAADCGARVTLLERNQKLGRKIYITGKGRCNVTNDCPADEVLRNVPHNSRFLYGALSRFGPQDTKAFFTRLGVPLKTERGNRVFPRSDRAADIIDALLLELRRKKVDIRQDRACEICRADGRVSGVRTEQGFLTCKALILATGGVSYPGTGSTGDGYEMSAAVGHTIVPPKPSLVPLESRDSFCPQMQGLSLRNVHLKMKSSKGKVLFSEQGELLFTHFGLSGPLILSASAHMRDFEKETYTASIDLKPALEEKKLEARILRDFEENTNKDLQNVLGALLPRLMIPVILQLTEIPGDTKVNSITKQQRHRLLETLKAFPVRIKGPRPVEEAIVTCGGVKVSEIDPKTMSSKLVGGLFFAGELIDVDAYTGGFNLQLAWSTGMTAGECAAEYSREG